MSRSDGVILRSDGVILRSDGVTLRSDGVILRSDGVILRGERLTAAGTGSVRVQRRCVDSLPMILVARLHVDLQRVSSAICRAS